jgi:hypothetical protein
MSNVTFSELDSHRFKVRIGKVTTSAGADVASILASAQALNLDMLIGRVITSDMRTIHQLEAHGFHLMDTLIHYKKTNFSGVASQIMGRFSLRFASMEDENPIRSLAEEAFSNYLSHYHADPKLDRSRCNEVYADWAARSCKGLPAADAMIVAICIDTKQFAGFGTLKWINSWNLCGPLFAVSSEFRGQGLFRGILERALYEGYLKKAQSFNYSTQITNLSTQKALCEMGFFPSKSEYTFHKWFK